SSARWWWIRRHTASRGAGFRSSSGQRNTTCFRHSFGGTDGWRREPSCYERSGDITRACSAGRSIPTSVSCEGNWKTTQHVRATFSRSERPAISSLLTRQGRRLDLANGPLGCRGHLVVSLLIHHLLKLGYRRGGRRPDLAQSHRHGEAYAGL